MLKVKHLQGRHYDGLTVFPFCGATVDSAELRGATSAEYMSIPENVNFHV